VNILEGFLDIGGVQANERIHAIFGSMNCLGFDFFDGPLLPEDHADT
jgi:hypothetical protein